MMVEPIVYKQLAFSVRYQSVLFPFDTIQFLHALEKNGFIITEQIGQIPFGTQLNVGGIVARKAQVSVSIDIDKQVLGVITPNPEDAAEELTAIETLLKPEFGLNSTDLAYFYEVLATAGTKTKKSHLTQWDAHFKNTPILQALAKVIGKQVSPFGLRLASRGVVPNSPDWFEIRMEPSISSPNDECNFTVVYRSAKRDDVLAFLKRLNSVLAELVSVVEA